MLASQFSEELKEAAQDAAEELQQAKHNFALVKWFISMPAYAFFTLSENDYHELCRTPLRYTDALGEALCIALEKQTGIPLEYQKRTPNGFVYTVDGLDDCLISVSSSNVHDVNVYIKQYYEHDWRKQSNFRYNADELRRTKQKIEAIEKEFVNGSLKQRINFVFKRRPFLCRAIRYAIGNLFRSYEERYSEILSDLHKSENDIRNRLKKLKAEHEIGCRRQTEIVFAVRPLTLWAETVNICSEAENGAVKEKLIGEGETYEGQN